MAKEKKVYDDVGSAVLQEVVKSLNNLIDLVETGADLAAIQADIAAGTSAVYKIIQSPSSNLPSGKVS